MTKSTSYCDFCGKEIHDSGCGTNPIYVNHQFGYESYDDGSTLDLELCIDCSKEFVDYIVSKSKYKTLTGKYE